MTTDIGFATQTPSLPGGGGTVAGLGETFSPDLATGTGTFSVPLDLPNGPNDIGPKLTLRYDTGSPNGWFGLGWSLPLPRITRSTTGGFPALDDSDVLVLDGSGPLILNPDGTRRPEVDSGDWRIAAVGPGIADGFLATDRNGTRFRMGTTADSRIIGPGGVVVAWLLAEIEDNLGERARFTWINDSGSRLLDTISYGTYQVRFSWQLRPDPIRTAAWGQMIVTSMRCQRIELLLVGDAQPVLRRWDFAYDTGDPSGVSLLASLTLTGKAEDGSELSAPPLRLGWTKPGTVRLEHVPAIDPSTAPPMLDRSRRVELIDWHGDGLPDVVAVAPGGAARVWRNEGGRWGRPTTVGEFAALADPLAAIGLIDVDGDGLADFVRLDVAAVGYQPRTTTGVARPVTWRSSPSVAFGSPSVRFADMDGDGQADLLYSAGDSLLVMARAKDGGWTNRPVVASVPGTTITKSAIDLADPHVHIADMSGDGNPDLVRIDGGGVRWWPHLGGGRFGDPIIMENPPLLPRDSDPSRLAVVDIDGDGCADLLLVDGGTVTWWPNCSGSRFGPPRTVRHLPTASMSEVRVADVLGVGTPALTFTVPTPAGGARWLALDLLGGVRCGLLETIDNGLGLTTRIEYGTSAAESARDRAFGEPWQSRLPIVLTVVTATATHDSATGRVERSEFRYHDGRFDTVRRELAGFARVDRDDLGDVDQPTLRTTRWFFNGARADGSEPTSEGERSSLRAIRGRIRGERRQTLDGHVFDETAWDWEVVDDPIDPRVVIARQRRSVKAVFEGAATPASAIVTETVTWDANGNARTGKEQSFLAQPLPPVAGPGARAGTEPTTGVVTPASNLAPHSSLITETTYASDPTGRYRSRISRIRQLDDIGDLVADTITLYDGLAFGSVGAGALVTSRHALAITDAQFGEIYGASPPDMNALGYVRRTEATGWWIDQARYQRAVDALGVSGSIAGPLGAITTLRIDPTGSQPSEVVDPGGNTLRSTYDPRICRAVRLDDASGSTMTATYDSLSRLLVQHEPGDGPTQPTLTVAYDTASVPVQITSTLASGHPGEPATVRRSYLDGVGRVIEVRIADSLGEIAEVATVFGPRGLPARVHIATPAVVGAWQSPNPNGAHLKLRYDAIGRLLATVRPDGAVRTSAHLPGIVEERDEESNRTDAGAQHAGSFIRRRLDPGGRVTGIEQSLPGRVVITKSGYDRRGVLSRHVGADGTATSIDHDLLGRALRVVRPERTQVSVLDACGNTVEVRAGGRLVLRTHDKSNRLVAVRHDNAANVPILKCTYHDNGAATPAGAGVGTSGGRLVSVDDEAGRTVYDYDERGRVTRKVMTPAGGTTMTLSMSYRPDGRLSRIVYPTTAGGVGQAVEYRYDRRGRLLSMAGLIDEITWDDFGHRVAVRYANGVQELTPHDPSTGWCQSISVAGPGGSLRQVALTHDLVGNLLGLTSPDVNLTWTYDYDDWHRLTQATGATGAETYVWSDSGDLAGRSGVGAFVYGQNGTASTLLSSAGTDTFAYDPNGGVVSGPWGTNHVDAEGRIRRIDLAVGGHYDLTYGHTGVLARQIVTNAGGQVTRRVVRPDALVSIEDGTLVVSFTDGDRIVARSAQGGATHWHHHDHLGSLVLLTDASGNDAGRIRYGPWGEVLERTGVASGPEEGFSGSSTTLDGLVLLGARWYCPQIGRFVSPDSQIANTTDPLAWNAYLYARGNPVSYSDPTGKSFWKIFGAIVAAIAIVALIVVVSVLTFGVGTIGIGAFIAVMAGIAAGGVIGGIAAARAGGAWDDILLGVLVGGAVGGWAALGAAVAGPALAGAFGLKGMLGGAVAGAVSGAINGAAMGFASGFAGGKNDGIGSILEKVLVGAVVGLVVGGAIGALSGYSPSSAKPGGVEGSTGGAGSGAQPSPGPGPAGGSPAGGFPGSPAVNGPTASTFEGTAGILAPRALGAGAEYAVGTYGPGVASALAPFAGSVIVQTVVVDLLAAPTSAFWDDIKYYVRTHNVSFDTPEFGGKF